MFQGFSYSVIGQSHVAKNKVCQDFSLNYVCSDFSAAIVADGHGGRRHFRSDVGSLLAAEAAKSSLIAFYANSEAFEEGFLANPNKMIRKIEKHIITSWNLAISAHYKLNPITEEEKAPLTEEQLQDLKMESIYGTTLLIAVMGKKFSFGMQIGDGSLVFIGANAEASMPIEDDETCPANLTASMCNSNAIDLFRQYYTTEPLIAAYASTDGLFTSFGSDAEFLDYHSIISSQLSNIESFETSVRKNLTKRTYYGTQDDISLAAIFSQDLVTIRNSALQRQVELNKQRAEVRKAEQEAKRTKNKIRYEKHQQAQMQEI